MLKKYLDKKTIIQNLSEHLVFQPITNRVYWEKLKKAGEAEILQYKNYFDNYKFEVLYASLYREVITKKNRKNYEEKYFDRRNALLSYTFLEAFYNDDSYLDKVTDLIWMILEETDWALPAHMCLKDSADTLPCHNEPILDLFTAETAAVLSFVYVVLKEKIDTISKNITTRMEDIINDRVIKNYLENYDYWYMGYRSDTPKPNNWNPWINSNVLLATLVFVKDKNIKADIIYKALETLNNYFDNYPFDGGCDEGPSYWFYAGLKALECADLLFCATNGKVNFFNEQKIINMAEYVIKAYIYNNRVVNFADSPSLLMADYSMLYKFGKILKNQKLLSLAKYSCDIGKAYPFKITHSCLNPRRLCCKYETKEEIEKSDYNLKFIKEIYLESINFFVVRENETDIKGLYLAAKGGHNNESHNHNDIGNFIVYKDGEPFIVDSGWMVYSALTFNKDTRYTLWINISEYHNLPKINGKNQCPGEEFKAKNVIYKTDDNEAVFSLDIKDAYENRDDINKWIRTIRFDKRKHKIEVTEDYSLNKTEEIELNFLTHKPMVKTDTGFLMTAQNGTELEFKIDNALFDDETETIEVDDSRLNDSWGEKLYRTKLKLKDVKPNDIIKYTIM